MITRSKWCNSGTISRVNEPCSAGAVRLDDSVEATRARILINSVTHHTTLPKNMNSGEVSSDVVTSRSDDISLHASSYKFLNN
jgi:hypothetical protein